VLLKKTKLSYIVKDLEKSNVLCAFTRRVFNYDLRFIQGKVEYGKVLRARKKFFDSVNTVCENAVFLEQKHKARILNVTAQARGRGALRVEDCLRGADAAITGENDIALCVLTADCLPIVLFQPKERIIGIVHAGWRGTQAHITEKIINKICHQSRSLPKYIKVYIGPGIRVCCYGIGDDLKPKFKNAIVKKKDGVYLDLIKANLGQLIKAGIDKKNIYDTCFCTSCDHKEFFSWRRGDGDNRMLTTVMMRHN